MTQKRSRLSLILKAIIPAVLLLPAVGCNLPRQKDPAEQRILLTETIPAAESEKLQIPTDTPLPTETPVPTDTPVPSLTPTAAATFGPSPTPTLGPEYFRGSLWYEPEFVSQEGLRYQGRLITTGCTAASVQMVLDFWNSYREEYKTVTAQTLINENGWQGQFNPSTGLNITNTEDDLRTLGYYLGMRQDSNKEELLAALERYGPLLILTKTEWTPFGENHMAVLTGYDPENDLVRILDPWQFGGVMEFPYENFDGIWSLNYLDDAYETLQRTFFFIVPFAELAPDNAPFVPYYVLAEVFSGD